MPKKVSHYQFSSLYDLLGRMGSSKVNDLTISSAIGQEWKTISNRDTYKFRHTIANCLLKGTDVRTKPKNTTTGSANLPLGQRMYKIRINEKLNS